MPRLPEIAVHAALTGHLVLSTLHTNSAAGAVTRLLDMGVDGYLLASCLTLRDRPAAGARAVQALPRSHRRPYRLPGQTARSARACRGMCRIGGRAAVDRCNGSGFLGRTSIVEVLETNDEIRRMMRPDVMVAQVEEAAVRAGMSTMALDGLRQMSCWNHHGRRGTPRHHRGLMRHAGFPLYRASK